MIGGQWYNPAVENQTGPLLVVEDIPDILTLLKATLEFKGYRVVTARDGQEALEDLFWSLLKPTSSSQRSTAFLASLSAWSASIYG